MQIIIFVLVIIIACVFIFFYFNGTKKNMEYVKSNIDGELYLVQSDETKQETADILAKIKRDVVRLSNYLYNKKDENDNKDYKEYIELLYKKANHIVFTENERGDKYTSYSVNKGEQIVFCLRTKDDKYQIHDYNLIMYVVLHEISHVACPIYDNHGPLFKKIFAFIAKNAINYNIYRKIDFEKSPVNYCGMMITDSII